MILKVGLSHRTAPVEVREQLAIRREDVPAVLDDLLKNAPITEAALLSTCNRVEVYAALSGTQDHQRLEAAGQAVVSRLASRSSATAARALTLAIGTDAVRHLFRVAASLDSLVVGEPQILGQLKDAIGIATEHHSVGPVLGRVLDRAVRVGKRVRSETQIGAGQVSISTVAVDLAAQIFGELHGKTVLLVGAGEMAEGAAKLLVKEGAELVVVNRSRERGEKLATEVGGTPREWAELNWCLIEADIVIASTSSPTFVITHEALKTARKARRGRSLFLIDIAVPRNIDPAVDSLDGVYHYDIDDLEQIVAESLSSRAQEAQRAESIVDDEVAAYEAKRGELALNPIIVALRGRIHHALEAELDKSLSTKLKHLGPAEREALHAMIDAATNKICHHPTTRLRAAASDPRATELVEIVTELFDLNDHGHGDAHKPNRPKDHS
ncbi:MAG: glutamyl-tRNA reductase [Polyangiaceae bacterium]